MNQYWLIAFLLLLGGVGFFGYRYGVNSTEVVCEKHDEAQQAETIAAEKHVITETQNQNQITEDTTHAFSDEINNIRNLYGITGVQPTASPAGDSVRRVSAPACGTQTSKKYKLTPEQCDQEEAKCNALWNWAQRQAAVK